MIIDKEKILVQMARQCIGNKELAEKAGINYSSVFRASTRKGTRPSTVGKIARALGCDVSEIIRK